MDDIFQDKMQRENWQDLVKECRAVMGDVNSITLKIAQHSIKLPSNPIRLLREDLEKIHEHLAQNKSLNWVFRNVTGRKFNYLLESCQVNECPIRTQDDVYILISHLDKTIKTENLVNRWNTFVAEVGGEPLSAGQQRLLPTLNEYLDTVELALNWKETVSNPLIPILDRFALEAEVCCTEQEDLLKLKVGLEAIEQRQILLAITKKVEDLKQYLLTGASGKAAHNSWSVLLKAVGERNTELWEVTLEELKRLSDLGPLKQEFDQITKTLEGIAARWVFQIIAQGGEGVPLLPPNDWTVAWKWSQANNWLNKLHAENNPEEIQHAILEEERRESRLLEDIITKSSWARQIERTTEPQKRSLYAWIQAIRRIGKGTGKYADKHRRDAKKEMDTCQGAIPVWIMPIHRVIENLKVSGNLFDVVIVDESSQSDLFALVSFFRAKKAVVVGDDKQISPESVGSDQSAVNELINRYLTGIPQKERFDLQTSLYDTSLRIFPGNLMLKEHFRCVPEIIQFSNDLSYGGAIEPLRLPKASEKLEPVVVTVRVAEGYREDSTAAINYPEADALIDKILECCADEKYRGRTMGIISLQGHEQARVIEEKLRERLGDTEMIERKIVCGDAYSFQGDERDVMFLSMVAASNRRSAALTKASDEKRFNVAASRARDQMWLFHSIDPNELNPNCIRYRLLTYCLDPKRITAEIDKVDDLFESQFERDVFKLIVARGYAVRPQVKVGRYNKKIDLVVDGVTNRLAVECDGARWHGPEQWEADNDRQRLLERIGWVFWRVRGSAFYRDSDKAMRPLWEKLNEMGIEPRH